MVLFMEKKKRIINEVVRFFFTVLLGLALSLMLFRILDVQLGVEILVVGVTVTLLAVYVVRLTVWVLKSSM